MNWFENWFDSHYYYLLYKNRDDKEAESFINNLMRYLKIPKKSKLIDIACGKGRHAIYFNKKGLNVTGIDLSQKSINIAKKNKKRNLRFAVHDMRMVFKKNTFDIVTNLFTSFGYFENDEDEQRTINAMSENLKKDGLLIIDFMNAKKAIRTLVKREEKKVNGITFYISRSIQKNNIIKNIKFSNNGKKYHFKEKVKALSLADLSQFIINAELEIIDVFGNYKLENFNAVNSDRLIIICKK